MASVLYDTPFSYSENGKFLAFIGPDGKLKLWDTATGVLKQEYTKNLHLSAPCSCLTWVQTAKAVSVQKPRKRKLSDGPQGEVQDVIGVGTTSGSILLYSVDSNSIITELSEHSDRVNCLSLHRNHLYSCADDNFIIQWDLTKHKVLSKWKSGSEKVKCVLALSCGEKLVTASRAIKLWNIEQKEVIATYAGHAAPVFIMREIGKGLFVSAAKGERTVNVWPSKNSSDSTAPTASFLLQDNVASFDSKSSSPMLCSVSESGVIHIFDNRNKPSKKNTMKPQLNVTIATEGDGTKAPSLPLPVHAALLLPDGNGVLIAYGNTAFLQFETLVFAEHKDEHVVLVRTVKKRVGADEFNSRTKVPAAGDDVEYVKGGATSLRKQRDVPLERRLENLALTPGEGPPKKDNMAHLLVQGLQSRDKDLIQDVLFRGEESIINSTVNNIPIQALAPLLRELTTLLHGKTFTNRVAVKWLNAVIKTHAAIILANPALQQLMGPISETIKSKMGGLSGLLRLSGRLNLVAQQMTAELVDDGLGEPLVTYQQRDTESESDVPSSSDDEDDWDEFSDMDDNDDDAH